MIWNTGSWSVGFKGYFDVWKAYQLYLRWTWSLLMIQQKQIYRPSHIVPAFGIENHFILNINSVQLVLASWSVGLKRRPWSRMPSTVSEGGKAVLACLSCTRHIVPSCVNHWSLAAPKNKARALCSHLCSLHYSLAPHTPYVQQKFPTHCTSWIWIL